MPVEVAKAVLDDLKEKEEVVSKSFENIPSITLIDIEESSTEDVTLKSPKSEKEEEEEEDFF